MTRPRPDSIEYAALHEDGLSELRALALQPHASVIALTGSGSRVLDLLTTPLAHLTAVDWNPAQSHLLELKCAAMRRLDQPGFLAFVGIAAERVRAATYRELRGNLSVPARAFWDARPASIADGIFYAGRWERCFALLARGLGWSRARRRERLLSCSSLDEQAAFWRASWNDALWRGSLRLASMRWLWRHVLREPGIDCIPATAPIADILGARFERASSNVLFAGSPWVQLVFRGRLTPEGPLPPHLEPDGYEHARASLDKLEIVTATLTSHLDARATAFDALSLSDISSYADAQSYQDLWRAIHARAGAEATVCERIFLVEPQLALPPGWRRERELEQRLEHSDRAVVYDFRVARRTPSQKP
ncbi:MAG: DUF3419 family protein [Planctomycetes bacterium]|nr:DUF3419 family protein [Planctomycetota bacterium]